MTSRRSPRLAAVLCTDREGRRRTGRGRRAVIHQGFCSAESPLAAMNHEGGTAAFGMAGQGERSDPAPSGGRRR